MAEGEGNAQPNDKDTGDTVINELSKHFKILASNMKQVIDSLPTPMKLDIEESQIDKLKNDIATSEEEFRRISKPMRKQDGHIRIASWNIMKLSKKSSRQYDVRKKSIVDTIEAYGFQLVAFQEITEDTLEGICTSLKDWNKSFASVKTKDKGPNIGAGFLWHNSVTVNDPSHGKVEEVTHSTMENGEEKTEKLVRKVFCLTIKLKDTDFELINVHLRSNDGQNELSILTKWHDKKISQETPVMYLGDFNYDLKIIELLNYKSVFPDTDKTNTLKDKCYDNFLIPDSIHDRVTQRNVADIQCKSSIVGLHTTFFVPTQESQKTAIHTIETSGLSPQIVSDHCPIYMDLKEVGAGGRVEKKEEEEKKEKKKKEEEEEKKEKKKKEEEEEEEKKKKKKKEEGKKKKK